MEILFFIYGTITKSVCATEKQKNVVAAAPYLFIFLSVFLLLSVSPRILSFFSLVFFFFLSSLCRLNSSGFLFFGIFHFLFFLFLFAFSKEFIEKVAKTNG